MIKNIIFDFGDIFINLDKPAVFTVLTQFGYTEITPDLDKIMKDYEMGLISSSDFILAMNRIFPEARPEDLKKAWNSILLDFPDYRLEFLEKLAAENTFRLFLLSNTNELHIDHVIKNMGLHRFERFKKCFEKFYLSHEINLRKPNKDIYTFVLEENNLKAEETFFVDDTKENTDTSSLLGIKSWNLIVGQEDIIDLKKWL
ncbi:HAD-IA family hydrolase [Cellulophaga tyrosinoxydans]|uniref:Putative hydrolase of the HAD superfamily n=1 Tax=Cellulophaga tyrosinoxydans TaxID=504486 RepID=A0A1W2BTG2_9FLAO|nr:HAD-IA family hydrolase [Cellulophaga tyrosinoxydans]SMC76179.1 putative hydrolase of the HAD superfamily [Cellulophaga tyrosinoxydans]